MSDDERALATVVGVPIEGPVMLLLVKVCPSKPHWFQRDAIAVTMEDALGSAVGHPT